MASELCMNCFSVKGQYETCPFCGYQEGTPPKQPHYLTPGTILGNHFIVGTSIGVGGFGITYRAYDTTLGVIVAIKEFYPVGLVNRSPGERKIGLLSGEKQIQYQEQLKRFLMEAQSIAQFGKAKDIVNVYDYFEENNTAYIIMEYIDGVLLKDYLEKQGRMEVKTALTIIEPVIEAVKKIHAQGIIHRDISPDNIFIADEEAIKVFDFGAARLSDSKEGMAAEKVIKVGYSAPEQYRDVALQGFYADIYSVGAILYQMVTGIKPIESTEREYKDELMSPKELGIEIDSNLDRAIMEALAVEPALRFQSITQLDDAIHGKRVAEYPKDKIKRKKRKRNLIITFSFLFLALILTGIALVNTVFQKPSKLFENNVTKDTVIIWVDNADTKKEFEEIAQKMVEINDDDSAAVTQMKKENRNVTYQIVDVEQTYHKDMDTVLQEQKQAKKALPTLFVSDHVKNPEQYGLVSYKDTVYQEMQPEDYYYLSVYQDSHPSMYEMPTSFDVLLFYAIGEQQDDSWKNKLEKRGIPQSSLLGKQKIANKEAGTIPLEQIQKANQDKQEHTCCSLEDAVTLSVFENQESIDNKAGKLTFEGNFVGSLSTWINIANTTEAACKWKQTTQRDATTLYGNSILAGAGYRSVLNNAKDGNQTIPYEVYVPTVEDKMLVKYSDRLAVTKEASDNQQIAAMRFVYFALEQQYCVINADTRYPMSNVCLQSDSGENASAFSTFFEINREQEAVHHLVQDCSYPCMLITKGTGDIYRFASYASKQQIKSRFSENQIKELCRSYDKGEEK